jgi:hypothetical protein
MMYPNQQPPMQGMANQMAQHGRYGDSMLVHMNPIEVQGLASLSPTGSLTVNPVTGQPEAFLPFLAPLLGSLAGSTLLTGAGAGALGGLIGTAGLSPALAGAIGSGLATTAATGDLKQGILSGLTGYGLGSVLGGAAKSIDPAVTAAQEAVTQGQGILDVASKSAIEAAAKGVPDVSVAAGLQGPPVPFAEEMARRAAQTNLSSAQGLLDTAGQQAQGQIGQSFMQNPMDFTKAIGSQIMSPSALVPIALGEGKREELRMQDEMDAMGRQERQRKQEELDRAVGMMRTSYGQLEQDYPGYKVPGYMAGGITSVNPQNYMQNLQGLQRLAGGGQTNYSPVINPAGAAQRQANIRGSEVISPAELQGYRPGFSPEIQYFKRPETTGAPQAGQDAVMGGEGAGQLSENQQQAINMALSGKGGMGFGGPNFDAMSYNYGANEPLSGMNAGSAFTAAGMGQQGIAGLGGRRSAKDDDTFSSNPRGNAYSRYTQQMQEGGEVAVDVAMQEQMPDESMAETSDANGGRLIELAALALLGRLPEEESKIVIEQFVMEFGEEALQMLRDRVLTDMSPNAQTEGKIEGNGKGMDDMIPGMIGDQQPVAVSPGEFIVPADVVSGLGDGDTDAGANELERMMGKVRQERTGTDQQPRPVNTQRVMPA